MNLENILRKLIKFPTVTSDVKTNRKALFLLKKEIEKTNVFYLKTFEKKNYPSLFAAVKRTKKPKILLVSHLDVVPASPKLFVPEKKKNKLIGRGVFDMKFAIACYLKLIFDLKKELKKYDLGIMITCDEEIGGWNGTKFLIDKGYGGHFVFLPDGGHNWFLEEGAKGVLHLKVEAFGRAAHGSRPWQGKNAINLLLEFLEEFKKLFPSEPCGDKFHYHNTFNVGKIEGGKAINQVCSFATLFLDIRYTPETKREEIFDYLRKIKKKIKKIEVKEILNATPFKNNLKIPEIATFKDLAYKIYGIKMKKIFSHGSSDARFFREKNIPVLSTRPRGGGLHQENEWIDLTDLERYYNVFKLWIKEILKNVS